MGISQEILLKGLTIYGILLVVEGFTLTMEDVCMKLYHGSTVLVTTPEIRTGAFFLDFGVGFYTTTSYEQAERWAKIKMRREQSAIGYVSVYDFDIDAASDQITIQRFFAADMDWLQFVVQNRKGLPFEHAMDMHVGPVADDNVYQSIRFFETGVLNAEETVKRLKTEVLHDQWTFHTPKALSYCRFIDYKEVR